MPTILIEKGFRFFFFSNEHFPKHIHISGKGGEAKIDLDTLEIMGQTYLKRKDIKQIQGIVLRNRFFFIRKWDEFFK